ncbi:hypothetical protein [Euzebya sp.]|uniref:hypothetical protein n=1 Tax=Euzebya sp. TaxID=1971409 RepID=UPI0035124D5D
MGLTPQQRSIRARLAAHALHAKTDGRAHTRPARDGFMRRFEDQVDPDRQLPEEERQRRAQHALTAHMTMLALRSAKARRKDAGTTRKPSGGA